MNKVCDLLRSTKPKFVKHISSQRFNDTNSVNSKSRFLSEKSSSFSVVTSPEKKKLQERTLAEEIKQAKITTNYLFQSINCPFNVSNINPN